MNEERLKRKRHSTFCIINGINSVMNIYEQLILQIPEEDVEIVMQHYGDYGLIAFVYTNPEVYILGS